MKMRSNSFLIFHFKEKTCEVLKWKVGRDSRKQIDGFWSLAYDHLEEKNIIAQKIKSVLKEVGYSNERVILAIPHKRVSSRFIKLPSLDNKEIEEMIYLQAAKDLPYTPEELVIGYEIVERDKEGFSCVNMVFIRRDIINELLGIFKEEQVEIEAVYLSTYGIVGLFNTAMPKETGEVLLVCVEADGLEITVLNKGKVFLSRFVNLSKQESGWQEEVFKQLMDTQSLYLRQGSFGPLKKVFLLGDAQTVADCKALLDEKMLIPVETPKLADSLFGIIRQEEVKQIPLSLTGFILRRPQDSLNLLPRDLKEARYSLKEDKIISRLFLIGIASVFMMFFAFFIYTGNKKTYLKFLDQELQKIQSQAKELEVMIKELEIFRNKRKVGFEILDYFAAIHKAIPAGMLITSLNYDAKEKEAFLIRGYSQKLDAVFNYASSLRTLDVFKAGEIKVKQASNKVTKEGEVVNFEIVFLKKK
jgi:hypothetical protein